MKLQTPSPPHDLALKSINIFEFFIRYVPGSTIAAMPSLVDLPPEMLQRIWNYIDWDRNVFLTPSYEAREAVFNISLTCKYLRQSVLPTLFHSVPLTLRFRDDDMLAPSILDLCRQRPDLAKHVKCIHISLGPDMRGPVLDNKTFSLQKILDFPKLHEVVGPAPDWECHDENLLSEHHNRLAEALRAVQAHLHQKPGSHTDLPASLRDPQEYSGCCPVPETDVEEFLKREFNFYSPPYSEAFWFVAACFPPTVKEIVFEDETGYPAVCSERGILLGLNMLFTAFDVFRNRLEKITVLQSAHFEEVVSFVQLQQPQALTKLHKVTSLTFAPSGADSKIKVLEDKTTLWSQAWFPWHSIPDNMTKLDVRNLYVHYDPDLDKRQPDRATLLGFIRGFSNLRSLSIANVFLRGHDGSGLIWLHFLMAARRARASLELRLQTLCYGLENDTRLSASSVKWLVEEAVPIDATIDSKQERRLVQDFTSFLALHPGEVMSAGWKP